MTISSTEYYKEISGIAKDLVSEAMIHTSEQEAAEELIQDSLLHETIDGHQWVIYNGYNLDVINHSDNDDYMTENFGGESLEASLKAGGLSGLHQAIAFWCMYADVQELLEQAMTDFLDTLEATQDANNG